MSESVRERRPVAEKKRKRKVAFRKNKKNISSALIVIAAALIFCGFMKMKSDDLEATKAQLTQEVTTLETKISDEQERTEELKEFEIYTHTKRYAEEVAKNVLGYVYEDEIIFKPED